MDYLARKVCLVLMLIVTGSVQFHSSQAAPATFVEYATSDQLSEAELKTLRAIFDRAGIDVANGITAEASQQLEKRILGGTGLAFGGFEEVEWMSGPSATLWSTGVTNIVLVTYFPHLERISLAGNEGVDLAPLLKLPNLKSLSFRRVQKFDVAVVAQLKSLDYLDLRESGIVDLAPLSTLHELKILGISRTAVKRLGGLGPQVLGHLTLLEAERVSLDDWECLAACSRLERLNARSSNLADLSPLSNAKSLSTLNVSGVKDVHSLKGLGELRQLKQLGVSGTAVDDLGPLAKVTSMERLYGEETNIADLRPLAGLTRLRELVISRSKVEDVSALAQLTDLELLDVRNTPVAESDLKSLAELLREHPNTKGHPIRLKIRSGKSVSGDLGIGDE